MIACIECNIFIYQISVFLKKTQSVADMMLELSENEKVNGRTKVHSNVNAVEFNGNPETNEDERAVDNETLMETGENASMDAAEASGIQRSRTQCTDETKMFTFKCHVCDAPEFKKMFQLSAHTRSEHKCLPMVKCCCDKFLSTMKSLEAHRAKHFPMPSDLKCSQCSRTFRTKRGVENHNEKSHGPLKQLYICARELENDLQSLTLIFGFLKECGKSFSESKVLERHEVTHELPSALRRNFECSDCGKTFISNDARKCHYAKHHEKLLNFFCDVCSKVKT